MIPPADGRCGNCAFFVRMTRELFEYIYDVAGEATPNPIPKGLCRRYPPTVNPRTGDTDCPQVNDVGWCGEWEHEGRRPVRDPEPSS